MVSLKLKGPRRPATRGSNSSRSKSAADSAPPSETGDVEMNDTIAVHRSPSPVRTAKPRRTPKAATPRSRAKRPTSSAGSDSKARKGKAVASTTTTNASDSMPASSDNSEERLKGTVIDLTSKFDSTNSLPPPFKGKAPARDANATDDDLEMVDTDDDDVEEYDFSNDPELDDAEYDDDGLDTEMYKKSNKDTNGVITISSDDEPLEKFSVPSSRPWKEMDKAARYEWESMYCKDIQWAMNGDWTLSEAVLAERDKEMMSYLQDFPLPEWVIPKAMAIGACNDLQQRFRWRKLGIPIYDRQQRMQWAQQGMHQQYAGFVSPNPQITALLNTSPYRYPGGLPASTMYPGGLPTSSMYPNGVSHTPPQAAPNGYAAHIPQPNTLPPPTNGVLPPQRAPGHTNGTPAPHPAATTSDTVVQAPNKPQTAMPPPPISDEVAQPKQSKKRKSRARQATPLEEAEAPRVPPPPPPYAIRERPQEREPTSKGRRKPAEAKDFPWNRQIDFTEARANATWDDSIYDQSTLAAMEVIRKHNEPIIERIDKEELARKGRSGLVKGQSSNLDGSSDTEKPRSGRKSSILSTAEGGNGDPYHSGHYSFATAEDGKKAAEVFGRDLGPDDILASAEDGLFTLDECKQAMVCWNPGKKGVTQDLKQVRFSIRDILVTRQQLNNSVILTRRAAECVVDFCPDMLWRATLLRVVSEAGYGNKDVRTRMCLNGNYCDKATITKRIGSALGQKQQQSATKKKKDGNPDDPSSQKVKGYAKGEREYYLNNVTDYDNYVEYFGHRVSHRGTLSLRKTLKRKAMHLDSEDASESSGAENSLRKIDVGSESTQSLDEEAGLADMAILEDEGDETVDDNADAVSVQSDTMLDEMDDD